MGNHQRKKTSPVVANQKPSRWWVPPGVAVLLATLWLGVSHWVRPKIEPATYSPTISPALTALSATPPAEWRDCAGCHAKEADEWRQSQHANAARLIDPKTDLPAFNRSRVELANGAQSILRSELGAPSILATKPDGSRAVFHPEAVIGVAPLVQYLAGFPGGRLQVFNFAFDPEKKDWFDAQGTEGRAQQDWSFWQNRGMNWNAQCAFCHMTNLRKGYDLKEDVYRTTWDAMGISCAQCHGSMAGHAANPKDKALLNQLTIKQMTENCGSCHARREELTGKFHAGEKFDDHYRLSLPDSPGLYYPDGQVKEEDFEFGSFSMSRMGHKGISCLDCHNPHSGKLRLPVENNSLCTSCHAAPGQRGAIPIDPAAHSHHKAGAPGALCVDCHMPITRYMVRDPRRDHGFTIPDPVLTKEIGVPNSCNRCHADKSADWAIDATMKWYGDKMERRSRQRARVIARAEKNDATVVPELLSLAGSEEIAAWRSVLITFLAQWTREPGVRGLLEKSLADESALVRASAVRALGQEPDTKKLIKPLCDDPARLVRLDAIWNLRKERDREHPSYRELTEYLAAICDQPAGALRQTQLALEENRSEDALKWSAKAADWDASSGEAHKVHALVLNTAGQRDAAVAELLKAGKVDPKNPEHPFMLALLYGEMNRPEEVIGQLKRTVELDPSFGRAWYNLGLALAQKEDLAASIEALQKAEKLQPGDPEAPYALATVHARAGQFKQARAAAARAQALGHQSAAELLQQLPQ